MNISYLTLAMCCSAVENAFNIYIDLRQRNAFLRYIRRTSHVDRKHSRVVYKKTLGIVKGFVESIETIAILYYRVMVFAWSWADWTVSATAPRWASNEYTTSILFVTVMLAYDAIKGIPWIIYDSSLIDRHSVHRTKKIICDSIKSSILIATLAPGVIAGAVCVLQTTSVYMPLHMWAFILGMQIIFMTIYPVCMFNNCAHLQEGELREDIHKLARLVNFPLRNIVVVTGSMRGGHSHAYMYGLGRNKRLVIHDNLLTGCNNKQIAAVVAHELGHWKLGHTMRLACIQQIIMLAQFCLFATIRQDNRLLVDFGFDGATKPSVISLFMFITTLGPVDKLVVWLFNILSRRFEFEADEFATTLIDSKQLIAALESIDNGNEVDFVADPLFSQYHYSHPPTLERTRALSNLTSVSKRKLGQHHNTL